MIKTFVIFFINSDLNFSKMMAFRPSVSHSKWQTLCPRLTSKVAICLSVSLVADLVFVVF